MRSDRIGDCLIGMMIFSAIPFFLLGWPCAADMTSTILYYSILSSFAVLILTAFLSSNQRPHFFRTVIVVNIFYSMFISYQWCWNAWVWLLLELLIVAYQVLSLAIVVGGGSWQLALPTLPLSYLVKCAGRWSRDSPQESPHSDRLLAEDNTTQDDEHTDSLDFSDYLQMSIVLSICTIAGMFAIGYLAFQRHQPFSTVSRYDPTSGGDMAQAAEDSQSSVPSVPQHGQSNGTDDSQEPPETSDTQGTSAATPLSPGTMPHDGNHDDRHPATMTDAAHAAGEQRSEIDQPTKPLNRDHHAAIPVNSLLEALPPLAPKELGADGGMFVEVLELGGLTAREVPLDLRSDASSSLAS